MNERCSALPCDTSIERLAREDAAHLERLDARGDRYGVCYFIGGIEGPIKIGFSRDLWSRVAALRSTVPYRIEVLAVAAGGRSRELYYHAKFRRHQQFGEWFARVPEVDAEVARLAGSVFSRQIVEPDALAARINKEAVT